MTHGATRGRARSGVRPGAVALSPVVIESVLNSGHVERDVPTPHAKPALGVDASDPQIERIALGRVLGGILSFDLEHQHLPVGQPDQEVRNESPPGPAPP